MVETVVDLHTHSKYARACSSKLTLPAISKACERKGIHIVSTGDFTHPLWFQEIQSELQEWRGSGLFTLKDGSSTTLFILGTEISLVYKHKGKVRRLHLLVYCPNIAAVLAFNSSLESRGCNLRSDGRPIVGISAREIMEICLSIDPKIMVIPAHAWTPWFAVFGSKSGYDSLEECFEEYASEIFAIETGLSSDPAMSRRLSSLDGITLISNSDAHSLEKLGREANVFSFASRELITYNEIRTILKSGDTNKFLYTIEFYPEEGMYHHDGHRDCEISLSPPESKRIDLLCPKCQKKLTIGVMHRVDDLADRGENEAPVRIPCKYIVPLQEIIAQSFGFGYGSKKVVRTYDQLLNEIGSEFYILLHADISKIEQAVGAIIAFGIKNMREGKLTIRPGYDGVYGVVSVL